MVKVSVIMPVYNCEDFLKDSIESILNQSLIDLELICVDDGSEDNSLNILNSYADVDSRVKVFALDHLGGGNAHNFALKRISGEYLYFMDADDILNLNAFEEFYEISKDKNLDFLIFKARKYDVDKKTLFEHDYYNMTGLSNFVKDDVFSFNDIGDLIFRINVTPWCKFYNTEFILGSGARFKNCSKFHDNLFFWDIIFQAQRIYFVDEFYYTQNVHSKSLIESRGEDHCDIIDVQKDIEDLFKKHGQFEKFKRDLYDWKMFRFVVRYDEIMDEYKELFFTKMKRNLELVSTDFRDFLAHNRKFVFDSILVSKNRIEFDLLKEYYYILEAGPESLNEKMNLVETWFDSLEDNHKRFVFNYIKEDFLNNDLTQENQEFLNRYSYKVSVIIPVFNVENYIEDAFKSLKNQAIGFENLEVIFVDDASTDSSPQIIEEYSDKYDNVISIFLDKNSGYGGRPRNVGMNYATSDYLMFLDPDDVFLENACEILYNQITSENLEIVCGVHNAGGSVPDWIWRNILTDPQENFNMRVKKTEETLKNLNFELKTSSVDEWPSVCAAANIWDKIFKKSLIINNKITFPEEIPAEDSMFLLNALLNANGIKFINEVIVKHNYNRSDSVQHQFSKTKIIKRLKAYFEMFYLCMDKDKTDIFKRYLLVTKLRHVLVDHIMKCNLPTNEILEILVYARPLFKLYADYGGIIPENLHVFEDIARGDFENALKFIQGENTPKQKDIKVATILDPFSNNSFKYEFDSINLTPDSWKEQFESEKPDLFLCESAYHGISDENNPNGVWAGKISKNPLDEDLKDILTYCSQNNIPTVFWNKEDPISFTDKFSFTNTALEFDYIFTSCEESVGEYNLRGHENVYPLMFASQPMLFNPIKRDRLKDTVVFAGSWYSKFPQRCRTMEEVFDKILNNNLKLKIYDRFSNSSMERMKYPEKYQPYVNDGVDYHQIPNVYKESEFGLNFNTITDSNTMFARRVFELMASNTQVLSNYSKGVYRLFGDNVVYLDRDDFDWNRNFDKIKEENLYNVLENHNYSKRFRQILDTINFKYIPDLKHIVLFYRLDDLKDLAKIQNHFHSIAYPYKHLKLITGKSNLFLSNAILEEDLESVELKDNYYFCFADLDLNLDFIKKALLHFQYICENIGIKANDENRYSFDKSDNSNNVVFNSAMFKDVLEGNDTDVYCI